MSSGRVLLLLERGAIRGSELYQCAQHWHGSSQREASRDYTDLAAAFGPKRVFSSVEWVMKLISKKNLEITALAVVLAQGARPLARP